MNKLLNIFKKAESYHDLILALFFFMAVMMMIIPLPTVVVDIIIAINISTALLLLMLSIYIKNPLELTSFPTILLITTLMRLSLSVSTTRLILLHHDAGDIIYSFGNFVVGGNIVVGLVIFTIITIVQFMVITKGAERVAEVSARFSLDGMPGKQMSIDGDMRAGVIDPLEAKVLRSRVQKESQFYGSMDGAMKFVKGDAIAGIIIVLVNLFGGVLIGMWQFDMPFSEALSLFSVLSVGDALVAQIPALIISVTAGVVVTRVPGESEKEENLAGDIVQQVSVNSRPFLISAALMIVMAIIPGFPTLVFLFLAVCLLGIAWKLQKKRTFGTGNNKDAMGADLSNSQNISPGAEPLILNLSSNIYSSDITQQIEVMRWNFFEESGIPLPKIIVNPVKNNDSAIEFLLYQESIYKDTLTDDTVYFEAGHAEISFEFVQEKLSANSIVYKTNEANQQLAHVSGMDVYAKTNDKITFLLKKLVLSNAKEFIGVQETRYLMDIMERKYNELVKELQRQLGLSKIVDILQRLVEENISIRDLRTIFETLIFWSTKEKDVVILCEYVRIALRRHILGRYSVRGTLLNVWLIGSDIENELRESIRQTSSGSYLNISPERSEQLIGFLKNIVNPTGNGVILTALDIRRYVKKMIEGSFPSVPVLSFQEVGNNIELKVLGTVNDFRA
ncbi:type III secretion system LEE export apparatus protein EscV [Escherichia albertii]|uniref:Type III secretion system LEE export apparatus protein EscV n=1 Tax=Escherichia coli TaxID=562 RepID=A0A789RL02_ECOLX|nr:type III secretion system LEE export apparatus protein EscV [Escherichia albertii]EEU9600026.1 type III secretion system LEE export apparatus protein EscV [Escherichia albertii]EEW0765542.1 type III secretion system LEE export apparatus protein EscV [Escherichia albertii]EEW0789807.1 type III secretion system LEE export apparatus protein EscV [Escherichia albertii]EEW4360500.1 type III secretion system LEE export apparatus protein EscV [Escherichia albertii]EEW6710632.1 type III secretion s